MIECDELPAYHVFPRVPEHLGRRAVHLDDPAVLAHREDRLERGLEHGCLARLALGEVALGPLTLDELAELRADRCHEVQEWLVGLPDAPTEELDDPEDLTGERHRERECRVQTVFEPAGGSREVRIRGNVGDPGRPALLPHASWKSGAFREAEARALPQESWACRRGCAPAPHEQQHPGVLIHAPHRADLPSEGLADGRDQLRCGLLERRRLRQRAGDGIQHHPTSLRLAPPPLALLKRGFDRLAFGDVDQRADRPEELAALVVHGRDREPYPRTARNLPLRLPRLAIADALLERLGGVVVPRTEQDVPDRPADRLGCVDPEHLLGTPVPPGDDRVRVRRDDGRPHDVQQQWIERLRPHRTHAVARRTVDLEPHGCRRTELDAPTVGHAIDKDEAPPSGIEQTGGRRGVETDALVGHLDAEDVLSQSDPKREVRADVVRTVADGV